MDESYGQGPAAAPPDEGMGEPAEQESVDDENANSQTAIVSNKILSPEGEPLKEGDEIVLQVVKNYGDESEVKYAPKGGSSDEPTETSDVANDFAAMDQEKA